LTQDVVTVSSNMFFAPLLKVNPHTPTDAVPDFPDLLQGMLQPSERSAKKALKYARSVDWGKDAPVVAIHIRAREEGEDNDDWPTANAPDRAMLEKLRLCLEAAATKELQGAKQFDVLVAATTQAARRAVSQALTGKVSRLRRVLSFDALLKRGADEGAEDAMAEALLISRADVFLRLVVGTSGFSTFASLSNALRQQNDWAAEEPGLHRSGFAPNYLVTASCGPGRCFSAPPEVRMAGIGWHGPKYTHRSCGDVLKKAERQGESQLGCRGLRPLDAAGHPGDEL